MIRDATVSDCGKYRYALRRERFEGSDPSGKLYAFFGVNPSTADALVDDATIRKLTGFVSRLGGRGFVVGNVFALRATDVKEIRSAIFPVGPENMWHIRHLAQTADVLVPCWGSRGKIPKELRAYLETTLSVLEGSGKPLMTFGLTNTGDPKHPLMLPYSTELVPLSEVKYD